MKKCPFCAEEIQDEAVKCRYCNEILNKPERQKWYFSMPAFIGAFLCVGPFALPLVWFNKDYSRRKRAIITAIALIASYFIVVFTINSLRSINNYYKILFELLDGVPG